jgi:hypothetical protein
MMSYELVFEMISKQYVSSLVALKACLLKAKTHAETNKFDSNKFLDMKLAPDMFNFTKQIQMVSDNAKGAVSRLSGKEAPRFEDNEKTFEELLTRIDKTINFISDFKSEDFKDYQNQKVSFPWYPGKYLSGHDYLVGFALPNFYFHTTTAYNLLRGAGVQVGKGDFLGNLNWQEG